MHSYEKTLTLECGTSVRVDVGSSGEIVLALMYLF